jgi:hypothetical protein
MIYFSSQPEIPKYISSLVNRSVQVEQSCQLPGSHISAPSWNLEGYLILPIWSLTLLNMSVSYFLTRSLLYYLHILCSMISSQHRIYKLQHCIRVVNKAEINFTHDYLLTFSMYHDWTTFTWEYGCWGMFYELQILSIAWKLNFTIS